MSYHIGAILLKLALCHKFPDKPSRERKRSVKTAGKRPCPPRLRLGLGEVWRDYVRATWFFAEFSL